MTMRRSRARRLVFFNHKGGVGKTTLTAQVAFAAAELGKTVLAVDADPQCNLTQYLLNEKTVDDLLDRSDGARGATVWSCIREVLHGKTDVPRHVTPRATAQPNLYLLPGDIQLALYEYAQYEYWHSIVAHRVGGSAGFTALARAVDKTAAHIGADLVLYDIGPNIGYLNRSILLDCDGFITPVLPDVFSRVALKTLGRTVQSWTQDWKTSGLLLDPKYAVLPGTPRYLGYTLGKFSTPGQPARSHAAASIQTAVQKYVTTLLVAGRRKSIASYLLASIADYGADMNNAISKHAPIWSVVPRSKGAFLELARNLTRR